MMSQSLFTGMVALFWVAEFAFGALIAYWFVTQGFDSDEETARTGPAPMEDRSVTVRSLALWGAFFVALLLGIIIGS